MSAISQCVTDRGLHPTLHLIVLCYAEGFSPVPEEVRQIPWDQKHCVAEIDILFLYLAFPGS